MLNDLDLIAIMAAILAAPSADTESYRDTWPTDAVDHALRLHDEARRALRQQNQTGCRVGRQHQDEQRHRDE